MIIEAYHDESWQKIATINLLGEEKVGFNASTELLYEFAYVDSCLKQNLLRGKYALSCHFEVSYAPYTLANWPSFLLDLFPQGAALEYVVDHYRIADRPENYWQILNTAVLSPPGNLRIKIADHQDEFSSKSFSKEEVISKGQYFLEYMIECGAPIAGSTGAGGAAPKYLLREDYNGRFYGERNLSDSLTKQCWLIKFPRGKSTEAINKKILHAEKYWMDIANKTGLNVNNGLEYHDGCLFVPRFDREKKSEKILYHGMESFYSLVESLEFGSRFRHKTYLDALQKFSNNKEQDLIEYILRDLLNLVMGNTDNHGRNHSVLKKEQNIQLSPLYDFAPMRSDPESIVRVTRWENDDAIFTELESYWEKEYNNSLSKLKNQLSTFWHKFCCIDWKDYAEFSEFITTQEDIRKNIDKQINLFLRK